MTRLIIPLITIICLSSCHSYQPLFEKQVDVVLNDSLAEQFYSPEEPVLAIGDKITVSIWGHNDLSIGSVNSVYTSNEATGKWLVLDDEGKANLPKLGRIKMSGLTVKEANYLLEQQYSRLLKDPVINVRVLNHFVTVLGEVKNPGRYSLDNESITLIEMLGKAQGLTYYSKNDAIELVRIIEGQPVKLTVDLTDLASLPKKNILMQPGDVVYIGPTQLKDDDRNLSKISLITSIATGIAVIFSVFVK